MNEPRYINANELKDTLDYYISEAGWTAAHNEALAWVKDEFIDAVETVDVALVIHGRWVITHDFDDNKAAMVPLGRVVRCSICGYPENRAESKYCPHCGAKMDESEDNDHA